MKPRKRKYHTPEEAHAARIANYRKWRAANHGKCLEKDRNRLALSKALVLLKLGNKCSNPACQWLNADGSRGCTDYRCLQIDHVNGDGPEDKKAGFIGFRLHQAVLEDIEGRYQLLCANCNWIKRHANQEQRCWPKNL